MHAIASSTQAAPQHRRQFSPKAVERHNNRLHYRAQVATFCDSLAAADLTATSYRVILDALARMLRQGRSTEAVGNEWTAKRLNVGRNAISSAYSSLEEAGFLRRIAVKHRGAPTRTRLINVCATLIDGAIPGDLPISGSTGHAERAELQAAGMVVAEDHHATPLDAGHVDTAPDAHHNVELVSAQEQGRADIAVAAEDTKSTQAQPANHVPFVYNHTIFASMVTKVPEQIRGEMMRITNGKACPVDPAWRLTENETRHYLALVPKPEARPQSQTTKTAAVTAFKCSAPPEIARVLWNSMERLTTATGSKTAAMAVADQIAFQIECAGLGIGDPAGGARAGMSLVHKGKWTSPRGYLASRWDGAVLRGLIGATTEESGHAPKTVR